MEWLLLALAGAGGDSLLQQLQRLEAGAAFLPYSRGYFPGAAAGTGAAAVGDGGQ